MTLILRAGGEITCPARLVVRVEPDEVAPDAAVTPAPRAPVALRPSRRRCTAALRSPYATLIVSAARRHGVIRGWSTR